MSSGASERGSSASDAEAASDEERRLLREECMVRRRRLVRSGEEDDDGEFARFAAALADAPVGVMFDMEGRTLGLPVSTTELLTVTLVADDLDARSAAAFFRALRRGRSGDWTEATDPRGLVFVIDVHPQLASREVRATVRRWLRNPRAVWVGYGIHGDLAALHQILADSDGAEEEADAEKPRVPLFLDLQVATSDGYACFDPTSEPPVDLNSIVQLKGLADVVGGDGSAEKQRFSWAIFSDTVRQGSNVSYTRRPLTVDAPCVVYAADDVAMLARAAASVWRLVGNSDRSLARLDQWARLMTAQYFCRNGLSNFCQRQLMYSTKAAQYCNMASKNFRSLRGKIAEEHRYIQGKYLSGNQFLAKIYKGMLLLAEQYDHCRNLPNAPRVPQATIERAAQDVRLYILSLGILSPDLQL